MHKVVEENFFSFITFRIDQFNCLCFFLWSSGFKNADETLYSRTKRIDHIFGRPFYNASIKTIALIFKILPITEVGRSDGLLLLNQSSNIDDFI